MGLDVQAGLAVPRASRAPVHALVVAARPRQWTKNLLVFGGLVFGARLGSASAWVETLACFVAYCAASSAAYLANDVRGRLADRAHPLKRFRPIASGEIPPRTAYAFAGVLLVIALAVTAPLGAPSLGLIALFVALQAGYTWKLQDVVLVDVLTIAGLFVIRAAAGAAAVGVLISPWLLLCTGLLALFLALGKRRAELLLVEARETPGRRVLQVYTLPMVDQFLAIAAASTIVAYALYTFTASYSDAMMITIPFVVYGILRYVLLLQREAGVEEPESVLVTDLPILATVAGWVVTCAGVILVGS